MLKKVCLSGLMVAFCYQASLGAHCQMPCGIYHDEMVFDQVDQYIETMVKGLTVLTDNKFNTLQDHNEFVRWIIQKDKASDEIAQVFLTYFLQQKIKPGEEDTTKRVLSAQKLLFLLVQIKQLVDMKVLYDFYEEWEKFKLMFHIDGYKCKVSQLKLKKWNEKVNSPQGGNGADHDHSHDDDHDHDHDDHDHFH